MGNSLATPIHLAVLHVFIHDWLQQCSQGLRWGWLEYSYLDPPSCHSWKSSSTDLCMKSKWFKWCLTMPSTTEGTASCSGPQKPGRPEDKPCKWKPQYKRYLSLSHDPCHHIDCSSEQWTHAYLAFIFLLMYFKKPFLSCTSLSWRFPNSIPV